MIIYRFSLFAALLFLADPLSFVKAAPPNFDAFRSARELKAACNDQDPTTKLGNLSDCIGFVVGVADSTEILVKTLEVNSPFCLPKEAKAGELIASFEAWLEHEPSYEEQPAALAVIMALRKLYPCARGASSSK